MPLEAREVIQEGIVGLARYPYGLSFQGLVGGGGHLFRACNVRLDQHRVAGGMPVGRMVGVDGFLVVTGLHAASGPINARADVRQCLRGPGGRCVTDP
jgi:hypothetical protein